MTGKRTIAGHCFGALLLAGLMLAPAVHAAVLRIRDDGEPRNPYCGNDQIQYIAGSGEANYIVVSAVHTGRENPGPSCVLGPFDLVPFQTDPRAEAVTGRTRVFEFGATMKAESPCTVSYNITVRATRRASMGACPAARYDSMLVSTGDGNDTVVIQGRAGLTAPFIRCGPGVDRVITVMGVGRSQIYPDCEEVVVVPTPL